MARDTQSYSDTDIHTIRERELCSQESQRHEYWGIFYATPQAQKHPRAFSSSCKRIQSPAASESVHFTVISVLAWGHVHLWLLFSHPLSTTPLANYHLWPQAPSDFHQMCSLWWKGKPSHMFTRSARIHLCRCHIVYMKNNRGTISRKRPVFIATVSFMEEWVEVSLWAIAASHQL